MVKDISAPGMLGYLLPAGLTVAILLGAAIALINDLPAMLLSVSRLMFAWAEDGVFPKSIAKIHPTLSTPYIALYVSGVFASIGVLGSHFAGDFFLGVDIMVTAMIVNFLLMCITLVAIKKVNPSLSNEIRILKNRNLQKAIGYLGILTLTFFLIIHIYKDLNKNVEAWYFHSTWIWIIVMTLGSAIFFYKMNKLKKEKVDIKKLFNELPNE